MKKYIFFISLILLFFSCQEDKNTPGILTLSTEVITINPEQQVLKVAIKTNQDWLVEGADSWCRPDKLSGNSDDSLFIDIDENPFTSKRNSTLTVKTQDLSKSIQITQMESAKIYHYKLPVVFHILYNDLSVPEQNLTAQYLYEILNQCNTIFAGSVHSVNCHLELIPATHDPKGTPLAEPGIERIPWPSSVTMDCNTFMDDKNVVPYVWDPNNYINIFVYTFSNKNVLGISYLPYTLSNHALEGLKFGDRYLTNPTLTYPHCLSVNNQFALTDHPILNVPDLVLTLTHELGHYIGLFHIFQDNNGLTDYCDDTETYDRKAYEDWLSNLVTPVTFEQLARRTTPDKKIFTSYNIMDYDFSYLNQFTPDQLKRMRHVLENSPLIPGIKQVTHRSRSNPNLEIPEARTITWERKTPKQLAKPGFTR